MRNKLKIYRLSAINYKQANIEPQCCAPGKAGKLGLNTNGLRECSIKILPRVHSWETESGHARQALAPSPPEARCHHEEGKCEPPVPRRGRRPSQVGVGWLLEASHLSLKDAGLDPGLAVAQHRSYLEHRKPSE